MRRAVPVVLGAVLLVLAPPAVLGPRPLFGRQSVVTMPPREQYVAQFLPADRRPFLETIDWLARTGRSILGIHLEHGPYTVERLLLDASPDWMFVYPFPRQPLPPDAPPDPLAELIVTDLPTG